MVSNSIDLKKLNLDELNGVINIYPWFAGARKELCRRMSELGEGAWSDERYADAALYLGSRRIIAELAHKGHKADYSDKDIKELLKAYIDEGVGEVNDEGQERRIIVVGGDYFSKSQYDRVKRDSDNIFSSFASKAKAEGYVEMPESDFTDICTETLASVYAEQGYYDQAKSIYDKLILRYPEKSAYFAALIEKLK